MSEVKKSQPKTGISIQNVSGRNKRPSKYKLIEPSKLEDLVKHQPQKYQLLPEDTLNHLSEGEVVKLVFVNREDIWVNVEAIDHEEATINGKIASKCRSLQGLQIGQLVSFKREHVVEVHEESDSDDDDY